jgi:hypothetical protein
MLSLSDEAFFLSFFIAFTLLSLVISLIWYLCLVQTYI